jgi:hypothetical protein
VDLGVGFGNSSMGLVEAELLRRVNEHLGDALSGKERARWIRDYLCADFLVPRESERALPPEHRVEQCRARGAAAVEAIRKAGYDVVGDLDDLLVAVVRVTRPAGTVTAEEVADVAADLVASMLTAMRDSADAARAT